MSSNGDSISDPSKGLIICCSLFAGFIVASIVGALTESFLLALPIFIIASFAYPFIGAFVVPVCEELRLWAHEDEVKPWTRDERAIFGAGWPLTLLVCLILYTFLGIINRIY
jgi:hypothetical protein